MWLFKTITLDQNESKQILVWEVDALLLWDDFLGGKWVEDKEGTGAFYYPTGKLSIPYKGDKLVLEIIIIKNLDITKPGKEVACG